MIILVWLLIFTGCLSKAQQAVLCNTKCTSHSIWIPRSISFNPIFENALTLYEKIKDENNFIFSAKPFYSQTTGKTLNRYFSLGHKQCLNVQENGSGDIDSLWFKVISSDDTFYSSILSLKANRKYYGSLFFFQVPLPCSMSLSLNTALAHAKHVIHACENAITNPGTATGFPNVVSSFAHCQRTHGRIPLCKNLGKTGLDDIEFKLNKNICFMNSVSQVYVLLGVPTGHGSNARTIFEPLVGSNHVQLGLGTDFKITLAECDYGSFSLLGELKWRYGFKKSECRLFDTCKNGDWSRYMLVTKESDPFLTEFASNNLVFNVNVTPQNNIDFYLALHYAQCNWNLELGYDYWYRSKEKICLKQCAFMPSGLGIADLKGIAALDPHTASTATISQSVQPGTNQMVSDSTFIPLSLCDLNLNSGAHPKSSSNSIYLAGSYTYQCYALGLNIAYEKGSNRNTTDTINTWVNLDVYF